MNKKQFREFCIEATPAQKQEGVENLIKRGLLAHPRDVVGVTQLGRPAGRPTGQFQQGMQQQQTALGPTGYGWHAVASVLTGNPYTYTRQRGFTGAITRTSAGIQVLTMQDALDIVGGDGVIFATPNGTFAVGSTVQASPTSATTITVTTATLTAVPAAVAADLSFWIGVLAIGPN